MEQFIDKIADILNDVMSPLPKFQKTTIDTCVKYSGIISLLLGAVSLFAGLTSLNLTGVFGYVTQYILFTALFRNIFSLLEVIGSVILLYSNTTLRLLKLSGWRYSFLGILCLTLSSLITVNILLFLVDVSLIYIWLQIRDGFIKVN